MVNLTELNKALSLRLKPYKKARDVLVFLKNDLQVNALLSAANAVTIQRLGYNDHGVTHSHLTTYGAVKMLMLLHDRGVQPHLVREYGGAMLDDSLEVVIFAAYLHDIGNAVMRTDHELFGTILVREILNRYYKKTSDLVERKKAMAMEGIAAHMGNYPALSIEAKVISVADACDMERGRARIPYKLGKKDIHSLSALSIRQVRIREGKKKPVRIHVQMDHSAGVFQIEELLIRKIRAATFEEFVEIEAHIVSSNETIRYFE